MSKVRMDSLELSVIRIKMIDSIDKFGSSLERYNEYMLSIVNSPVLKGKFFEDANKIVQDVKEAKNKLKSDIEKITEILKDSQIRSENTEEEFSNIFRDISEVDLGEVLDINLDKLE